MEYEDDASGVMSTTSPCADVITLRPRIVIAGEASEERVAKLVHQAHEHCYIANSLNGEVVLEPRVEFAQVSR